MKGKSCVVLLSAGLDSTVNLYQAHQEMEVKRAVTFNYGQRAFKKEAEMAESLCDQLEVNHQIIELPWFAEITSSSLVDTSETVPVGDMVSIDNISTSHESAKSVWVPNRNGVFLNIGAAIAEGLGADFIIPGFNAEEAKTFPDNSEEYMQALDNSFSYSTANKLLVKCYTAPLNKTEIVKLGKTLGVDFDKVWPCYFSGDEKCGECESCQRFYRAMEEAK